MTGDRTNGCVSGPDFAAIIDRALSRQMREDLATFLAEYQHLEFGHERQLNGEEVALVLTSMDYFFKESSFISFRITKFTDLHRRLSACAARAEVSARETLRLRNACFDALACIKALEARLIRLHYRAAMPRARLAQESANDC